MLNNLYEKLVANIDRILNFFQVEYTNYNEKRRGICPVHMGDNQSAFVLYPNGMWKCWSNGCDSLYGPSIFGLIRGLLSRTKPTSKKETINWCYNFLQERQENISYDLNRQWIKINHVFTKNISNTTSNLTKIVENLQIPSSYYLKLGYSKEVLQKYKIGLCLDKTSDMYNRSVFPIYNDINLIGYAGRSINEKCDKCNLYHDAECPLPHPAYAKWRYSKGFLAGNWFFNFHEAKKHINQYSSCILCEGQADVLRLEDIGIHTALGLFGCDITDNQRLLLERLNCLNIILALDNDKAGEAAKQKLTEKLQNTYNISYLTFSGKDVGETSINELRDSYNASYSRYS